MLRVKSKKDGDYINYALNKKVPKRRQFASGPIKYGKLGGLNVSTLALCNVKRNGLNYLDLGN